ncbi:MAG TPA: methyltransferase domain-containing protein [Acidimicrobiales bacterium]|nr:methyltransferase domain-containing protein [Acidimicrobiales bacterium]
MRAEKDLGSFDVAADEYDAARPSYPDGLFDLLESRAGLLAGKCIVDGGAGTGIASRQLIARGAQVVAVEPGVQMLTRARRRAPSVPVVAADAAALPLRRGSFDMACFAQSWHWIDQSAAAAEVAQLLGPSGWWAAWWSHPWPTQRRGSTGTFPCSREAARGIPPPAGHRRLRPSGREEWRL